MEDYVYEYTYDNGFQIELSTLTIEEVHNQLDCFQYKDSSGITFLMYSLDDNKMQKFKQMVKAEIEENIKSSLKFIKEGKKQLKIIRKELK